MTFTSPGDSNLQPARHWRRWIVVVTAMGMCAALLGPAQARAKTQARRPAAATSYASVDECIISKVIDEPLCRTAFANARAEFDEKAPRFATRQACEGQFAQCAIMLPVQAAAVSRMAKTSSGVEYAPSMERVQIVPGKAGEKMAVPVTRASRIALHFDARSLTKPETEISAKRGEAARQSWQAALARANRPAATSYAGAVLPAGSISYADPQAGLATDNPASYPVSAQRWNQMKSAIDRINRGQKAPAAQ